MFVQYEQNLLKISIIFFFKPYFCHWNKSDTPIFENILIIEVLQIVAHMQQRYQGKSDATILKDFATVDPK